MAIDCLKIDNILHYSSEKITNEFGNYFASVGKNCAAKLPSSQTNIKEYLKMLPSCKNSIFLEPCSKEELTKLVSNLANKNSSGYDKISNV